MRGWKPWTVQPPIGTPIDWENPLSVGLVDAVEGYGEHITKILRTPLTYAGTTPALGSPGPHGLSIDTRAAYGIAYAARSDTAYCATAATHVMVGSLKSANSSYCSIGAVTTGASNAFSIQWNGGSSWYVVGAGGSASVSFSAPLGPPIVLSVCGDPSGSLVYLNGAQVAAASTITPQVLTGAGLCILGQYFNSVLRSIEGTTSLQLVYHRKLGPSEQRALSANPWQVFHRRRRAYSIPTSSGAAGTAAITEASDTVSATGNIAIPGTASITEASDTVAATGALAIAGTAAITEGSDTVSATGALSVTGTAAITESDDTVSATGALSVTGSATITEQPDATAATGGITLSGAASIFEGGDIVVASGALALPGTASITEASDSVAGTGSVPTQVIQGSPQWTISRSFTRTFTIRRSVPRNFTLSRSYTRNFTVTPMAVRFPIKGTSEKVPLTFDFTQDLPSGVTLTGTPVLGVSVSNGTDSNPTGILNGAAGFNSGSTQVIQPVQGGVNGVDYAVTCTCTTTQSNLTLSLVGLLSVRRDLN